MTELQILVAFLVLLALLVLWTAWRLCMKTAGQIRPTPTPPRITAAMDEAERLLKSIDDAESLHPLSDSASLARRPLPPEELVGALHDTVHKNIGKGRPARVVRYSERDQDTEGEV